MSPATAERWVIVSAATVGGVYAYLAWKGEAQTPASEFITAWGVVFFILALITTASPGVGGAFAILIMVSDLLGNMPALAKLVQVPAAQPATAKPKAAK